MGRCVILTIVLVILGVSVGCGSDPEEAKKKNSVPKKKKPVKRKPGELFTHKEYYMGKNKQGAPLLKAQIGMKVGKDGKDIYHGQYVRWERNTHKYCQGAYVNGVKDGRWIFYHTETGREKEVGSFKKGRKSGKWHEYYDDEEKTVKSTGNFRSGRKDGVWVTRFENGKTESEGEYREGRRHGMWSIYHENEKIRFKGEYLDDMREGLWETYDEKGKKVSTQNYAKGQIVPDQEQEPRRRPNPNKRPNG